jgi:putative ABC transport system permease protein
MLLLAWRGVRHNTGRYIATILAIVTGVAFFSSAGFISDRVIDALEGDVNRQYGAVEAALVPDSSSDFAADVRIPGDVATAVAALDQVDGIAGELTAPVAFLGAGGKPIATSATGRLWIDDEVLNPIDVVEGAAPSDADEVAVDRGLADDEGFAIGDSLTLLTASGQFPVRLVGITEFGSSGAIDGSGTVSIPAASAFAWLNSGREEYLELLVRGNVGEVELAQALEELAPNGFVAQRGSEFLTDKRSEASAFGRILKTGLSAFSLLALFVGGFVIYNTFNVIVTQRLRELAVLSAIGATPKQLRRSLRFEGLVVGLVGSALGVATGFGLAFGLIAVLELFGFELPGSGLVASPNNITSGLLAGTAITYLSVRAPARKAARTEPIEALRQSAVEIVAVSRRRIITVVVLTAVGAVLLLSGGGPGLGLGGLALFVATIAAGPLLAMGSARVLRPFADRLGLEGRLAIDNTARNPQRTATTANALLIGVFLVTLVTVAGTSIKDFAVGEINKLAGADFILASQGGAIDDELVTSLEGIDGVEGVVSFRHQTVTLDGDPSAISAADLDRLTKVATLELRSGSFDDLTDDTIVMGGSSSIGAAATAEPEVGDRVSITGSTGTTVELEVVGVIESSLDVAFTGNFVTDATFARIVGDQPPNQAFMSVASGRETDVEEAADELLSVRPDISLTKGSSFGELIGQIFDFLINAVNGLLLMSVAVALIGIVNTMSLSILERRRELGLLRVVGMIDRRVRRMVRIESIIIAALGTVAGMALGVLIGWAMVRAIASADVAVQFSMPWLLLGAVLVLGVVLGFLAALLPAHRSTRLDVLESIQAT